VLRRRSPDVGWTPCQHVPDEKCFTCVGPLRGSSKLIPIHEEPNHQIVHLFRLGKHSVDHQPLDASP